MAQHHLSRENQRARIDLVLTGVLRRGTMRSFEHGDRVGKVCPGGNTDTADLSGKRVGQVVTVQVECCDDVVRSEEHTSELQSLMRISYAVFCLKKKNRRQNRT